MFSTGKIVFTSSKRLGKIGNGDDKDAIEIDSRSRFGRLVPSFLVSHLSDASGDVVRFSVVRGIGKPRLLILILFDAVW